MKRSSIAVLTLAALLAATANVAPARAATTQAASSLQREVFGFALASSLSDPTVGYPSWDFSLLSTVAFFGLHINDDGTIASDSGLTVWNSSALTNLLSAAHAHGTKVVLTIIEQDFSAGTPHMCATLANRATVVSQTVTQVTAKGVDGVNIDFEGLNGTCPNGQSAQLMMTDLAHRLRSSLPAASYLSVDTYASSAGDSLGFFDVAGLDAYVDSFFVMAYDLEYSNYKRSPLSCLSFCLGPTAPLTGYYYNDTTTAGEYMAAVGASKVILGVPYYGRKSCVASAAPNAAPTGAVTADTYLSASTEMTASEVKSGSYATHHDSNDPAGQERWDTWFNTTLGCTRELYWDDAVSLGLKYDLVNKDGLRGVGIWNLNYGGGATELWNALAGHFRRCTSVTLSPSPTSPQTVGTPIQFTASSSGCFNPLYQFWTRPASGTWTMVQDYSSASTFKWTSTGAAGSYYIGVHVRDAASTAPYDSVAGVSYTLAPAVCSAVSLSAAPASPQKSGTSITVTATATCPNASPKFQFLALWAGTNTWIVQQPYSTGTTWTWNSTGARGGIERFGVWVKDSGSPNAYDKVASIPYTVTPACSAVSITVAPASPQAADTSITVTATATCPDANPQFQFLALWAGTNTWIVQKTYSTSTTWTWKSTGAPPGIERFGVWVRDAGSSATYDAVNSIPYTVK
jgi:spore germination protein YaaH